MQGKLSSRLTGQPPWPKARAIHPDIIESGTVDNVRRKIALCQRRLEEIVAAEESDNTAEMNRQRTHILKIRSMMLLALDQAIMHEQVLDMARHHSGAGPCSVATVKKQ
jgi:hypothetical protein